MLFQWFQYEIESKANMERTWTVTHREKLCTDSQQGTWVCEAGALLTHIQIYSLTGQRRLTCKSVCKFWQFVYITTDAELVNGACSASGGEGDYGAPIRNACGPLIRGSDPKTQLFPCHAVNPTCTLTCPLSISLSRSRTTKTMSFTCTVNRRENEACGNSPGPS